MTLAGYSCAEPVVVLTRDEVIDVRENVTVAELTTRVRGLLVEVPVDHASVGLHEPGVLNADAIQTIAKRRLTTFVGVLDDHTLDAACAAVRGAIWVPPDRLTEVRAGARANRDDSVRFVVAVERYAWVLL